MRVFKDQEGLEKWAKNNGYQFDYPRCYPVAVIPVNSMGNDPIRLKFFYYEELKTAVDQLKKKEHFCTCGKCEK